ncbi:hypothetical protein BGZ96_011819 [Linnemannia gamsii]|uniref:Nas2 N-terminal domain-containing protein n=1 Tax=Linnemannia gamsii TaxID=64522 RepID=A0ABQ7JS66_9FUNG|nr:hypothetical protein BGZ96_011819 [Linnemannia gamsii]
MPRSMEQYKTVSDLKKELATAEIELAKLESRILALDTFSTNSSLQLEELRELAKTGGDPVIIERAAIRQQMVKNNVGVTEMNEVDLSHLRARVRMLEDRIANFPGQQ